MEKTKYLGMIRETKLIFLVKKGNFLKSIEANVEPKYAGLFPNSTLWDLYSEDSRKYEGRITDTTFKLKNKYNWIGSSSALISGEIKSNGSETEIHYKTYNFNFVQIVLFLFLVWLLGGMLIDQIQKDPVSVELLQLLAVSISCFGLMYLFIRFRTKVVHKEFENDLNIYANNAKRHKE